MLFGKKKKPEAGAPGLWQRLRHGLDKTRAGLFGNMAELFSRGSIDNETLEEIETRLLLADVGVEGTQRICDSLREALKSGRLGDGEDVIRILHGQMLSRLQPLQAALPVNLDRKPFVILVIGVNGAGKTTTIGKLAYRLQSAGHSVLLAAGDTFRAAAIEQVQEWGRRNQVPVIAQQHGADAAAVIYDALAAARARDIDIVIADTAGRLHNKDNLMAELQKIRRTITKFDPGLAVETLLVLDAGTGQNALVQAEQFHQAIGVSGIALTKLDGSARGGIVFALAERLGLPLRYIAVGEQLGDLQPFEAETFVDALLGSDP